MKSKLLLSLVVFVLIATKSFAQIVFEDGYIVTNEDKRVNCLILNKDWRNNPSTFNYKLNNDAEEKIGSIETISEFGLDGVKYERHTVSLDTSSDITANLTSTRQPLFASHTLFLKVVLEGKYSLYEVTLPGLKRFFYRLEDGPIEALINKRYEIRKNTYPHVEIWTNDAFKQTLANLDPSIPLKEAERLRYGSRDLIAYFKRLNGNETKVFTPQTAKTKLLFNVKAGVKYAQAHIWNTLTEFDESGTAISPVLGVEIEYSLPFNKNKWSMLLEPRYQQFKITDNLLDINYHSLEVQLGARYYMHINPTGRIFLTGTFTQDIPFNSTMIMRKYYGPTVRDTKVDIETGTSFNLGVGYSTKRFSIEPRYEFKRHITRGYAVLSSSFSGPSVMLGMRIN